MPEDAKRRGKRKTRVGFVISDAMRKTIVVRVERRIRHPLYGKEMRVSNKLYAHDEQGAAHVGDRVEVMETRPVSRLKRWRLLQVFAKHAPARQA